MPEPHIDVAGPCWDPDGRKMQVPAPFEYRRATSVAEAIELRAQLGADAHFVAGGHSLLPMMKLRLAAPEYVIDINDLEELFYLRREGDEVRIGAMTRHRELLESAVLNELFPIFADAERVIADPVVRNRGTIGGSLCQADPAEDLSAVCATLDASCVIQGPSGQRVVSMDDFHVGPYETAVGDDEMLIEIRIPIRPNGSSAYEKVERRAGDWAIAAAGAAVWMNGPTIAMGRVGLAAVGSEPHIEACSSLLAGATPSEELYRQVGAAAAENSNPSSDARGSEAYKRHLAAELTARALRRSVARATGEEA